MKDDEDINGRLARLRVEQDRPPQGGRQAAVSRALAWWRRFLRRRRRGDALLAMTAVLIAGVIIAAIVVLVISLASGGGDKQPASAITFQRTPTVVKRASPSPITPATATPELPTAQPAYRQDCAAIRGTEYQSEAERVYFQQNCLEPAEQPAPATNPGQPAAAPLAATPVPGGSDASNAIGLAVDWIAHQASPSYTTDAGLCNAVQTSGHWVVTCNARLSGCQGSVCEAIVSVCVLSDLTAIRPSNQC
jgi:hypothetical protein